MGVTDREFDLILVGATGFVGRLTAAHLARSAPDNIRIALAGRSLGKLQRIRADLPPVAQDWPLITADVTDCSAADGLAGRAGVIASTVGPYFTYGRELIAACAEQGTDYADLTGEVLFVRDAIERHHARAVESGARLVPSCGFDSVPSDVGMMLADNASAADGEGRVVEATMHVRRARGGFGGGSIDSLRQQFIAIREDPSTRRIVADPDALAVERTAYGRASRTIGKDRGTGRWHGPFVMSGFNSRIVRRSASLRHGDAPLVYKEVVDTGRGPKGAIIAAGIGLGTAALAASMASGPTRWVMDRFLPAPGEGPSPEQRAAGSFEIQIDAETTTGARYGVSVAAPYDPGYDGTAIMLGESALALAAQQGSARCGVLTPATAFGDALADRLRAHDFTLEVRRE